MTSHNRSYRKWYEQLLREREGRRGYDREVFVLRLLLALDKGK